VVVVEAQLKKLSGCATLRRQGSFDKCVESHKATRGATEVDAAFLQVYEQFLGKAIRLTRLEVSLKIRYNTSVENMFGRQPQGVWKWADVS